MNEASYTKSISEDLMFYNLPIESERSKISDIISKKLNKTIIGKSHCGRKIEMFKVGNTGKKILLAGCFHGTEWISYLVLIKFLNDIINENIKVSNQIFVVPCMNPDGVDISILGADSAGKYKNLVDQIGKLNNWKSNARGVDLNHNFDAGWQDVRKREKENNIKGPSNTRFGGLKPESELETQSIVKLCDDEKFDLAFAFHSQGEEIYWDYGKNTPKESLDIAKKISNLTGYEISIPEEMAIGGGFKDWFIEKFKKPGFTIELGKGTNPLPISDLEKTYSKIYNLFCWITTS